MRWKKAILRLFSQMQFDEALAALMAAEAERPDEAAWILSMRLFMLRQAQRFDEALAVLRHNERTIKAEVAQSWRESIELARAIEQRKRLGWIKGRWTHDG